MTKKKIDREAGEEAVGLAAYRYGALDYGRGVPSHRNPYLDAFKMQSWAAGWYAAEERSNEAKAKG